jgi:hypothetical protein
VHVDIKQISGGTQVIGPNGTVIQNGAPADQLTTAVAGLFDTLNRHRGDLADPEQVKVAALAVRAEAAEPQPRKDRLLTLLRDLGTGAGDVAAVAAAVQSVATIAGSLS